MKLPRLRRPRRRRTVVALVVAGAIVLALAVLVVVTRPAGVHTVSRFVAGTSGERRPAGRSWTRRSTCPTTTPAPAILLAHGFGGDKTDLDTQARDLARAGYVVLTYSARGFGKSGGLVHLDAPAFEVADASKLVDYLATQESVRGRQRRGTEDRRGGLVLRRRAGPAARRDRPRIDAVGADITWNRPGAGAVPERRRRPDRGVQEAVGRLSVPGRAAAPDRSIRAAASSPRTCAPLTSAPRKAELRTPP